MVETMQQLTLFDYEQMPLKELETIVSRGIGTFVEVGLALLAIRNGKKYREDGYSDFDAYLSEKWGIGRSTGYRLIDAGYIANELSPIGDKPPTHESQMRPLTRLGNTKNPAPELWAEAWIAACENAEGNLPTAKEVEAVVKEMLWSEPPPMPPDTYRVIYADPPWQFDNSGFDQSAASHYPTMSTEDICKMRVPAAENSVLFMWAVNSMLQDGLDVMKSWGFHYKTNFVWVKTKGPTIGFYTQSRHELLLIGTRGEGMLPETKPISVLSGEVTRHSRKPEGIYDIIEAMYDGPYIELFAREAREGWDCWGNEPDIADKPAED